MIAGLLLSTSSVYLNKLVFADDPWSDIAKRQQEQQATAAAIYGDKYQFNNMAASATDYNPLPYLTTDETTKGRDLSGLAQMSLENAMATFDKEHIRQLTGTWGTGYPGLSSVTTDEQGRNRNTMIVDARDQVDKQVTDLVSQLAQIEQAYVTMGFTTTDEKGYNRQAQIETNSGAQEAQAAALLNQIWQIDQSYLNIQRGATTNGYGAGMEQGRTAGYTEAPQLSDSQAYALKKAVQIFEEIHAARLADTYSTDYPGLSSTTTNEQIVGPGVHGLADRTTEINTATEMALQNAINFYNAYYPNTPLSQPSYSHGTPLSYQTTH